MSRPASHHVPTTVGVLLCGAAAALPAWGNRGPASTSVADLFLLPVALWWVARALRSSPSPLPWFTAPALFLVLAGAIAGSVGDHPELAALAVGTDLYLLLAALGTATVVAASPTWARRVSQAWVLGAVASSIPLLLSAWHLIPEAAGGILVTSDHRAFGTFANPNLAGSYFGVSIFVLHGVVRRWGWRWALTVPLMMAMALTGSIAALLGMALAVAFLVLRGVVRAAAVDNPHRARSAAAALLAGLAASIAVALAGPALAVMPSQVAASSALHDSFGRLDRSDNGRVQLWSLALHQLGERVVIGVGPGAAGAELRNLSDRGKSLHSDVLAALLERGLAGAVALALLLCAVIASALRVGRHHLAFAVAVITLVPQLVTHEILHFRHVWLLVGVLAGMQLLRTAPARSVT